MLSFTSLFSAFALVSFVVAHGTVDQITVGGVQYTGYLPYSDPFTPPLFPDRIMRNMPGNGPIEDVDNIAMQCNAGANPAKLVAPAAPGDEIAMRWTPWDLSHKGPVITYLAKAPAGTDVTTWSPGTDAVWFKVDEAGFDNGKWAATDILMGEKNSVWKFNLPKDLAAGQYIVRHEIIALHIAFNFPGAQFYPNCFQIEVSGSGTTTPAASELVSIPGAYKGSDAGVTFNIYNNPTSYTIPGPPVFVSGGSSPAPAPAPVSSAAAPSSSPAPDTLPEDVPPSSSTEIADAPDSGAERSTDTYNTNMQARAKLNGRYGHLLL